jgi:hypothetical protein
MHLIQILVPLYGNGGQALPSALFDQVFGELAQQFGGVTAYQRALADGAWQEPGQGVNYDRLVIFEVLVDALDRSWWDGYRQTLEQRFRQEKVLIRAILVEEL